MATNGTQLFVQTDGTTAIDTTTYFSPSSSSPTVFHSDGLAWAFFYCLS